MNLTFPTGFQKGYASYRALTRHHNPIPVYMAALSQRPLLQMLEFATKDLKRNRNVPPKQTSWFWGLQCRLGDVGIMDSEAVSVVRELGKKAVWVGLGYFDQDAARFTAEYGERGN
jgi:Survival motor neuron (SMN) interacting protein 1 (SIP1)